MVLVVLWVCGGSGGSLDLVGLWIWWFSNPDPDLGDYAGPSWGPTRLDHLTQLLTCSSVSRYSSWKLNALAEEGTTALENLSPWTTILLVPQKA